MIQQKELTMKKNRELGSLVVGIVLGLTISLIIYTLVRIAGELEYFTNLISLFSWRLHQIVQPIFGLVAVIFAIRGKLRKAAWMMLGYFLFEIVSGTITGITYWP